MLVGTEPSSRPARLLSPRVADDHQVDAAVLGHLRELVHRIALTASVSTRSAPAVRARPAASHRTSSAGLEPDTF
jgi:hypothetical protein